MSSPSVWSVAAGVLLVENRPFTLSALVMEVSRATSGADARNVPAIAATLRSELTRRLYLFRKNAQGEYLIGDEEAALRSDEVRGVVHRLIAGKLERYASLLPSVSRNTWSTKDARLTLEALRRDPALRFGEPCAE